MTQDIKTFLGFVLIGVMILLWMWWNAPPPKTAEQLAADSTHAAQVAPVAPPPVAAPPQQAELPDSTRRHTAFGALFTKYSTGQWQDVTVHTSLYDAVLTTHGGALRKFQLAKYKTWDQHPVEMIDESRSTQLNLLFESSEGKLISTRDLFFAASGPPAIDLHNDSATVLFTLSLDSGRSIEKRFTFHDGDYLVDAEFRFVNCGAILGNYRYQVTWDDGIPFQEHNSIDECQSAEARAYMNGEEQTLDADKFDQQYKKTPTGATNWVAIRNKYFAAALIAPKAADGAYLEGKRIGLPDNGAKEEYTVALQFPYHKGAVESAHVRAYIGPLDYSIVRGLDVELEKMMSFGWAWIIRPIGVYFMLPIFNFIHTFIPNYGLVIIIFSLIIKALLTPLSLGQMKSTKKMQLMQPLMAEMKDKYKDDPAKMNSETMKLYSTYGINPLGGCLPLVMQMPILYAMWALLRNAIQLRQSSFVGWISDLSIPDVVVNLPFRLPLFGIQQLSGLAILMGAAIFVQQKMTIKDPRQKTMVFLMPIMLTLMFASLPSGLNLYYLMFNLFSIGQQTWFNRRHSEITLESVKKERAESGGGKQTFTQRVLAAQKQASKNNKPKRR